MAQSSPWPVIHAEREALIADLRTLDDAAWATRSLCDQWTVREVLGHMTATAKKTPPKFFASMAAAGFNFNKMLATDVRKETAGTAADGVAEFSRVQGLTSHPPGPIETWLGETIVHSEDIRRPLGIAHKYPADAIVRVADSYKGSNLVIGAKNRIAGLTLKATDADWAHGSGPEVSGPVLSLLLAMTGRASALDDLAGDGVETLRARA